MENLTREEQDTLRALVEVKIAEIKEDIDYTNRAIIDKNYSGALMKDIGENIEKAKLRLLTLQNIISKLTQ